MRLKTRDEIERRKSAKNLHYWLTKHVRTKDEHAPSHLSVRPFPQYRYLGFCAELIEEKIKDHNGHEVHKWHTVLIGKSRQILMSWFCTAVCVHRARFNANRLVVMQSKRKDDAKAGGRVEIDGKGVGLGLMGRAHFIEQNMTPGLRVPIPPNKTEMSYANGSIIWAVPHGQDVIRSHVPSLYWPDEFSFHGNVAGEEWAAAQPALEGGVGQCIVSTTPNGHEFFYSLAPWDHWRDWPEEEKGVHVWKLGERRLAMFIHYTADPNKRSVEFRSSIAERYKQYRGASGNRRRLREMEGDFGIHSGEPVWPEFDERIHVIKDKDPVLLPEQAVWRGWDFGYNGQACVWAQMAEDGQVVILRSELQQKLGLGKMVIIVRMEWTDRQYIDVGDPSSKAHDAKGETVQATMTKLGICLREKTTSGRKVTIIDQVRDLFALRADGTPGILIYERTNQTLIQALQGGYHFPEKKEGQAEKEIPEKDGFYDHLGDALQYLIDHLKPAARAGVGGFNKPKFQWRPRHSESGYSGYGSTN